MSPVSSLKRMLVFHIFPPLGVQSINNYKTTAYQSTQFSSTLPGIRDNSRTLFVTSINSREIAWDAISISTELITIPWDSNSARIFPC
jgi:hypothetical protein